MQHVWSIANMATQVSVSAYVDVYINECDCEYLGESQCMCVCTCESQCVCVYTCETQCVCVHV